MVSKCPKLLKEVSINLGLPLEEVTDIFDEYCLDLKTHIKQFEQPEYDYFGIGKLTTALPKLKNQMDNEFFNEEKREKAQIVYNKVVTIYELDRLEIAKASFNFDEKGFSDKGKEHRAKKRGILKFLKENGSSYPRSIYRALGYSKMGDIRYELNLLRKEKKIRMTGVYKRTKYELV